MRRQIVYPSQVPLDTDQLNFNRNVMIALGKLCGALFGTGGLVNGLAVTPTIPASLSVQIGAGEIYQLENVDNTAYGTLAADTTDTCVKQGIQLQPVTEVITPPATAGYSQCFLIEATFQEVDGNNVVLPYYNSNNINSAFNGPPNNPGLQQPTQRDGQVFLQVKAGIAAVTGSQQVPATDAGYIGLAVVTVANGQATITAANISPVTTNVLPTNVLQSMQQGVMNYAVDSGAANAYIANLAPAPAALHAGMFISLGSISATNTGGCSLEILTAAGYVTLPIVGPAGAALQGNELPTGGGALFRVNAAASAVHLVWTSGAMPVGSASASNHAAQFGQLTGVIGATRRLKMVLTAAAATATFTADQIIVGTALNGIQYALANYNQTINIATVGVGGMDSGAAPANGFVAVYAIYNPTTNTQGVIGQVVTGSVAPTTVYTGAHMPAGYTSSALISILATNGSSQFVPVVQADRTIEIVPTAAITTTTQQATATPLSIASIVPPGCQSCSGILHIQGNSISGLCSSTAGGVMAGSSIIGQENVTGVASSASASMIEGNFNTVLQGQTLYYTWAAFSGTATFIIYINGYSI